LKSLVTGVREVEQALGTSEKARSVSEAKNLLIVRRSIVAAAPIDKGELLTPSNICFKRPGTVISAIRWDEIVGS
jgi:N,N'-diacetyllegionaminate synthase